MSADVQHSATSAEVGGGIGAATGLALGYWDARRRKVAKRHAALYITGAAFAGGIVGAILGWGMSAKPNTNP